MDTKPKQESLTGIENFNLKPLIKWAGGKTILSNILLEIVNISMKKEKINYYEPFFGGGALFFRLVSEDKIKSAVINDKIPHLVSFYETIKNKKNINAIHEQTISFEKEFNNLDTRKKRETIYKQWSDEFNSLWLNIETIDKKEVIKGHTKPRNMDERIRSASLFLALNKAGFNGMFRLNNSGKFNIPIGDKTQLNIVNEDSLERASKALKDVEIHCGSYEEILPPNKKIDPKTSFIYLDPPYIPNSKTASFTDYSKEGFKEEDHIKLAEVFQELVNGGYKVVLSNNNNPEAVGKYVKGTKKTFAYEVMVTRQIASTVTDKKGVSTRPKVSELLVSSFNLDELGLTKIDS
tara:strand:- start:129 stop:1178 length:1050 start_codon:yes stop_codon:yes gene_type:complete